jgi:hypothetical protein
MKIIAKAALGLLVVLVGSSLAGATNAMNASAQSFNPFCPPGYYCPTIGIPGSISNFASSPQPLVPIPLSPSNFPYPPSVNPGTLPVIPCILYHICFPDTLIPFSLPPLQQPNGQVPFAPLQQPNGQVPFAPLQSFAPLPTFGRSVLGSASSTNTTIGDFNRMVIAEHAMLYNKSGLSEPQASISGLRMLASAGAITPNEFSQLSEIPIILASNLTSSEKTNRIYLVDQTLKSQGASPAAIVIADAASNTKPINPVEIGLKPTVALTHSGSSAASVGYQYGIAGALIGAGVGGPVGAAVGGFGGAILGAILSLLQ